MIVDILTLTILIIILMIIVINFHKDKKVKKRRTIYENLNKPNKFNHDRLNLLEDAIVRIDEKLDAPIEGNIDLINLYNRIDDIRRIIRVVKKY